VIIPIHIKMNRLYFYSYKLWYWIGCKCWFFIPYNKQKDTAMKKARKCLEDAFTPQLKKLIEDGWCDKCGNFRGEDE
jgi:hypothetical protein